MSVPHVIFVKSIQIDMSLEVTSPRALLSQRSLVEKRVSNSQRPKVRRFNSKIFERPPEIEGKIEAFALYQVDFPYLKKRKIAEKLRKRSFKWAFWNAVLTVVVLGCAFAENELAWHDKVGILQKTALRVVIIAISSMQIVVTIKSARCRLKRRKLHGLQHVKSKRYLGSLLYDRRNLAVLVFEILHLCIILPPWFDSNLHIDHNNQVYDLPVNSLLTIFIFLRVYHIFIFLYSQSPYHSQRARFYTKLNGNYDDFWFITRAQMSERPFITLSVIGAIVSVMAGLLMHTIERSPRPDLLVYDGPWYVAVTQLTVGYGEIVALTDIGRVLAIIAGSLGVLTLTLVVTFAFHQLALSSHEKVMIEALYTRHYQQTRLKGLAALYIQRKWRLQKARQYNLPNRLLEIFKMQEIHTLFKKKFRKSLQATPELEDQIRIFNSNVFKILSEGKRKLRVLKEYLTATDLLSTKQVTITASILGLRRAYCRAILTPTAHTRLFHPTRRRHSQRNRRNSIINKRQSDQALRKLM